LLAFDSKIDPSILIPLFRRQSTMLDLSYCHALILANRPFLLASLTSLTRNCWSDIERYRENVDKCVNAALTVVQRVNSLINSGQMLKAFWFTQYVCFCAVVVLYIHAIQQHFRPRKSQRGTPLGQSANDGYDTISNAVMDKFAIAELCQQHIATATEGNSLGVRYNIVLEELRLEVLRQSKKTQQDPSREAPPTTKYKTKDILHQPLLPHDAMANTESNMHLGTRATQAGTLPIIDSTWPSNDSRQNQGAEATKQDFECDWMPYQGDDLLMPPEFSEMGSTLPDTMADILGWGQFDAVVSVLVLSNIYDHRG
jgi:hypothetical protein